MEDSISYDCIKNATVSPDDADKPDKSSHCTRFLPESEIRALVQRSSVRSTLDHFSKEKDFRKLVEFYATGKTSKLFLTLVYIDAQNITTWESLRTVNFTDDFLPVDMKVKGRETEIRSLNDDGKPNSKKSFTVASGWNTKRRDDFLRDQWLFVVPRFRQTQFAYQFPDDCRLPFVRIEGGKSYGGHFGKVYQLGLRLDHTDFKSPNVVRHSQMLRRHFLTAAQLSATNDGYIEVALKVTTIQHTKTTDTDVETFYKKEKRTLKVMRGLNHEHLIKAIAAYKRGEYRCFIFPWAQGNNLQSFWEKNPSKLSPDLVTWAIAQMLGITGGIKLLHKKNIRHGDIKPANILYFGKPKDESDWKQLVVADVGLAKLHKDYTRLRDPGTTTRHGSEKYEPIEMSSFSPDTAKISRVYDTWSLGCVFLEFTIWLLYGRQGLRAFNQELAARKPSKFWEQAGAEATPRRHTAVEKWIERIKNDLKESGALVSLIKIISEKLLVADTDGQRATSRILLAKLKEIQSECSKGNFGFGSDDMARIRLSPEQEPTSQQVASPSSQVGHSS